MKILKKQIMKSINYFRLPAITAFIICISVSTAFGQLSCGSNEMSEQLLAQHPELLEKYAQYETYTQNYVKNMESTQNKTGRKAPTSAPTVYVIPIVFHILHQNGPENISDAQINDEMRILNEDYAKLNPDTSAIATPHFKSIAANLQIKFVLAKIDPNGNCTNGIDRIYTNRTNNAGDLSKLNQWDPKKYLNVWVVKSIGSAGVAGYAYFPWEVDGFLSPNDGVLILNNYIGSIGTSSPLTSRALTHEIGHVLNLEHPWGLTNSPGVACGDDGVEDTPDTKGWNHCPVDTNAAKVCDTIRRSPVYLLVENYQNYMDYSYCSCMFTDGQKLRIYAALNSTMAGRKDLWDTANLKATGVYSPPLEACVPKPDFYSNTCFVCAGSSVNFYGESLNAAATGWQWTFSGASVSISNVQNPVVQFDSLWSHTISLTTSDSVGSNSITKWGYIYVSPLWTNYYGTFTEGFENNTEVNNNWLFVNQFNNRSFWQLTNNASSGGQNSIKLNAYFPIVYTTNSSPANIVDPGIGSNDVDDAITPSVDLSTASAMTLSFDYSCATAATSPTGITEALNIDFSLNCGATWSTIKTLTGVALANAGFWNTPFTPRAQSDWQNVTIPVPTFANGKPNVRFRFEYISSQYSNNIYIDNVNLTGTVGINSVKADEFNLSVYPNPMSKSATVTYNLPTDQNVQIGVYDVTGRELIELGKGLQPAGQHTISLNNQNLSEGIYFVKMVSGNSKTATKKLIVIK